MNILVVDDEPIMREAYDTLIDWKENGFNLIGSAADGSKALDMMRANEVDIVITDLKMPVMSGLELIGAARREFPDVRFIVMSGFDDFTLVKEAFVLGVKEYFLKAELDPDAILSALLKLRQEIEDERFINTQKQHNLQEISIKMQEMTKLEKIVHNNRFVLCEKLLKEMIWGTSPDSTQKRLKEYDVDLTPHSLSIMIFSLYDYYGEEAKNWNGEREILKYAVLNVLDELCGNYGNLYPFCNLPHEFVILSSDSETQRSNIDFDSFFESVKTAVRECFNLSCDCGFSGPLSGYDKLRSLYAEAEQALGYSFVQGHGKLVRYSSIKLTSGASINVSERVQNIKELLAKADTAVCETGIHTLRISPNDVNYENMDDVRNLYYLYYVEIIDFFYKNGMQNRITDKIASFDKIKARADLRELNGWLRDSITDISDAVRENIGIANRAKSYIKHHYKEQITLSTVAEYLGVSTGHLSRTFQEEVGQNFTQYLLNFRMNTAANLLKTTNLKVYEVAAEVGYTNTEQFSKMFKKIIGKSPKSFVR
ncbi:MAG: response regulator [Clostridia bacterium]|nr:response regulator [Clostridia bacterium]